MITAGGGHLISAIEATDISTSPADGRQPRLVALVAPTAIRTLKFLQGLATLGRVPLLRATWLLDACLVSSGLQPTMTTTATTSEASQEAFDRGGAAGIDPPEDVPLKLLASATNREVYELPRGVDRLTNRTIAPYVANPSLLARFVVARRLDLSILLIYSASVVNSPLLRCFFTELPLLRCMPAYPATGR